MHEPTKFDPTGLRINAAINRVLFHEHAAPVQNRMMQDLYDLGFSGTAIGKALDVPSVYTRIDAHRGRGPAFRTG